ncbi:MAG: iron-containing alcohol dehydrogenase [Bacteroidales bacterium]|nr:iron-containing alcohol dehydrogenase [Bacteroidales bacterium]
MINSFYLARIPDIHFGAGKFNQIGEIIRTFGRNILVITGNRSLEENGKWDVLKSILKKEGINFDRKTLISEPDPEFIDQITGEYKNKKVDVVLAIGGGSVMDAGKAVSAMIPIGDRVEEYLEGVGTKSHPGIKLPFIAVPTTAGTGSETTKNAVISKVGENGFKKSLRHDNFIPDVAIVDPELTLDLPKHITAACGQDAFTQLLESFVSSKATPLTDALALSGLEQIKYSLLTAAIENPKDIKARSGMAYAAMLSGITLANAGLGLVHGFASSIGGMFSIPHGTICGTLMGACTRANIELLSENKSNEKALNKYAKVGRLFLQGKIESDADVAMALADLIDKWTEILEIHRLSDFGVSDDSLSQIIESTGQKNNPVKIEKSILTKILKSRL